MNDIVFYNPPGLYELLKKNPELRNPDAFLEGWGAMACWVRDLVCLCDRTETIPHIIKGMKPVRPLTFDLDYKSPTLTEICGKRWQEFLSLDKQLNILWSGGTDSVLIITEAIKHLSPEQLKNITILYTDDSLTENQIFFDTVIRDNEFKTRKFESPSNLLYEYDENEIYISGEYGDQMFGSTKLEITLLNTIKNVYGHLFTPDIFYNGWKMGTPLGIRIAIEEQIKKAPFEIKSAAEFSWWYGITLKHTDVVLRIQHLTGNKNVYAFFDTWDFDQWSMQYNRDASIEDKKIYKKPFNELIAEIANKYYAYIFLEKGFSLKHGRPYYEHRDAGKPLLLHRHETIFKI